MIEVAQRPAHGLVAVGAHVVDDPTDRRLQIGIEDRRRALVRTGLAGPASSIADQVIERSTDMSDEGIG